MDRPAQNHWTTAVYVMGAVLLGVLAVLMLPDVLAAQDPVPFGAAYGNENYGSPGKAVVQGLCKPGNWLRYLGILACILIAMWYGVTESKKPLSTGNKWADVLILAFLIFPIYNWTGFIGLMYEPGSKWWAALTSNGCWSPQALQRHVTGEGGLLDFGNLEGTLRGGILLFETVLVALIYGWAFWHAFQGARGQHSDWAKFIKLLFFGTLALGLPEVLRMFGLDMPTVFQLFPG